MCAADVPHGAPRVPQRCSPECKCSRILFSVFGVALPKASGRRGHKAQSYQPLTRTPISLHNLDTSTRAQRIAMSTSSSILISR